MPLLADCTIEVEKFETVSLRTNSPFIVNPVGLGESVSNRLSASRSQRVAESLDETDDLTLLGF